MALLPHAERPVHGLALCAGAGGLELGLRLALGPSYRVVAHVERDPYAAAVLVARMADAAVDQAPVWDDLRTFAGAPWRGLVDIVSAGFPCQPFSAAGRRAGADDYRWLWPDVARVVAEVGPSLVVLENVPGLLAGGLGPVLGDLADLGFDAEWDSFSAADLGAPHLRRRIFILAWLADPDGRGRSQPGIHARPRAEGSGASTAHRGGADVADPDGGGGGAGIGPGADATERAEPGDTDDALGYPGGPGPEGASDPAPGRWYLPAGPDPDVWPPGPGDRWGWEQAARAGLPQPAVRRVADGLADRLDRLHVVGNGVVPVVAGYALCRLAQRAGLDLGLPAGLEVIA